MKRLCLLASLSLAACGSASNEAAGSNRAAATSVDAVTAEAVADTRAATSDATNAADAELDRLGNSIDDADAGNRVSNGTAVVEY